MSGARRLAAFAPMVLSLLAGCAFTSSATPAGGAPHFAPSDRVEIVTAPPSGATLLGHVEAKGNNWQNLNGCKQRLTREARELGASALVVSREEDGQFIGHGPRCEGDAYRVADAK